MRWNCGETNVVAILQANRAKSIFEIQSLLASPRHWSSCQRRLKWEMIQIRMIIIEKIDNKYLRKMFPSYHRNPEVYDASIKIISREKMRCLLKIYSILKQHLIRYTISPILTLWKNDEGLPGFRIAIFRTNSSTKSKAKLQALKCRCERNFTESVTHL